MTNVKLSNYERLKILSENPEVVKIAKKSSYCITAACFMADVGHGFLYDAEEQLNKLKLRMRHDKKTRAGFLAAECRKLKVEFMKTCYELTGESPYDDDFADRADFVKDIVLLAIDRAGKDPDMWQKIKSTIYNFPSKLGIYD